MAAILDTGRRWRTQFWKGITQGSFQQSLVEIGWVVSEENFFLISSHFFLFLAWRPSWLKVGITGHNFGRGPSKDHSTTVWLQLTQWFLRRRFLCEFPIGSYVKLSSAVGHLDRRAELPDTFLEENHPMTISSKFCSYWANGFRQEDFYGNFP